MGTHWYKESPRVWRIRTIPTLIGCVGSALSREIGLCRSRICIFSWVRAVVRGCRQSGSPGARAPRELRDSSTHVLLPSPEPAPTQPHVARGARLVARAPFRVRGASPPQPVQPLLPTVFIRGRRAEAEASSPVPVAVACTVAAAASQTLAQGKGNARELGRPRPSLSPEP